MHFPILEYILFILISSCHCIDIVLQKMEQDKAEGVMITPLISDDPTNFNRALVPKLLKMMMMKSYRWNQRNF